MLRGSTQHSSRAQGEILTTSGGSTPMLRHRTCVPQRPRARSGTIVSSVCTGPGRPKPVLMVPSVHVTLPALGPSTAAPLPLLSQGPPLTSATAVVLSFSFCRHLLTTMSERPLPRASADDAPSPASWRSCTHASTGGGGQLHGCNTTQVCLRRHGTPNKRATTAKATGRPPALAPAPASEPAQTPAGARMGCALAWLDLPAESCQSLAGSRQVCRCSGRARTPLCAHRHHQASGCGSLSQRRRPTATAQLIAQSQGCHTWQKSRTLSLPELLATSFAAWLCGTCGPRV